MTLFQVFEDELSKDGADKWTVMKDTKFQSFIWCLLVAFEEYLARDYNQKVFSQMHLFPVFMNLMSKYSPIVIRLLMMPVSITGKEGFPLLVSS